MCIQANTFNSIVLLSLGSNLGDRMKNINSALHLLDANDNINLLKSSAFFETEPLGYKNQPVFLNIAALCETNLGVYDLWNECRQIELAIGRKNRPRWHEREIDIDILLVDKLILEEKDLSIPHPRMQERMFVLQPASEIAPEMIHPVFNLAIKSLLDKCTDKSEVNRL